jgi:hypothetical protein
MSFTRAVRPVMVLVASLLLALPAHADDLADFHAAVEEASADYRTAIATLETQGQQETSAAVNQLRRTWQSINARFGPNRPAAFADDEQYSSMFMLVDMRLIGVLLTIDMGNRDAARDGLAPIEETLSRLSARSAPPAR